MILYIGPDEVEEWDKLPPIILDTNWLSRVLGRLGGPLAFTDYKVCPVQFSHVERVEVQDGTLELTELAKLIASLETEVPNTL